VYSFGKCSRIPCTGVENSHFHFEIENRKSAPKNTLDFLTIEYFELRLGTFFGNEKGKTRQIVIITDEYKKRRKIEVNWISSMELYGSVVLLKIEKTTTSI
jgi:hypothetical protein